MCVVYRACVCVCVSFPTVCCVFYDMLVLCVLFGNWYFATHTTPIHIQRQHNGTTNHLAASIQRHKATHRMCSMWNNPTLIRWFRLKMTFCRTNVCEICVSGTSTACVWNALLNCLKRNIRTYNIKYGALCCCALSTIETYIVGKVESYYLLCDNGQYQIWIYNFDSIALHCIVFWKSCVTCSGEPFLIMMSCTFVFFFLSKAQLKIIIPFNPPVIYLSSCQSCFCWLILNFLFLTK